MLSYFCTFRPFLNLFQLAARFPNRPLRIALHSYKAPEIIVEDGKVDVILHASAGLMVELVNGTLFDAFSIYLVWTLISLNNRQGSFFS